MGSGIIANFKKMRDFGRYKNRERDLENEIIRASVEDSKFYENYSSFIHGLEQKLEYLLDDEGFKEVVFKPKGTENAKYFRAIMDDEHFSTNYRITKTVGGEFSFELRTLDEFKSI